jgi:hypothetical protein
MNLKIIIEKIAEKHALDLSLIKSGNNGPYNHNENILRNYCHWIVTFSKLYYQNQNKIYYNAIKELSNFLFLSEARPLGFSFHHRTVIGKDSSNGLMGQAWTFEALYECYRVLKDERFVELAEEVYNFHKFDMEEGLWYTLDINGKSLEIDAAFNHQLWFAYSAAQIIPKKSSKFNNINIFLEKINYNLKLLDNGVVYHPIEKYALKNLLRKEEPLYIKLKRNLKLILINKSFSHFFVDKEEVLIKWQNEIMIKSYGYHAFNMYAFVKFEKLTHQNKFWKSNRFKQMIDVLFNDEFLEKNENNKYSYPYNPTGFEIAFVASEKIIDEIEKIKQISLSVNRQFKLNFNNNDFIFSKNNNDHNTLTARLYELVSIPLSILSKIKIEESNEY